MSVNSFKIEVTTQGHYDMVNITELIEEHIKIEGSGLVHLCLQGTTCSLVVMEDEGGLQQDFVSMCEKYLPEKAEYEHHQKWGDKNGAAHLKSAFMGIEITLPIRQGKIKLGTWQSIMLIDFDERPRQRIIIGTVLS